MHSAPVLAALRRHKLTAGLLTLQVAFTCAIVCNVAFMIAQHVARMHTPSGVAENQLVTIESVSLDLHANQLALHRADLAALRMIPGVRAAAAVDALPFNGNDWSTSVPPGPDAPGNVQASAFNGSPGELHALGLHLVAGRDFLPDEYVPLGSAHDDDGLDHVPAAIITQALAERLFHGRDPLGKLIYPGTGGVRIVGVVARLLRPDAGNGPDRDFSVLYPMLPDNRDITYVLRTAPRDRERVLKQAVATLNRIDGNRVLRDPQTFTQLRAAYFHGDRTMIGLLLASALGLLFVTALGITGLAHFWVQQRTRSIGIRRALGATRGDILRYFQTENFLIVSFGIVLGAMLAIAIDLALMKFFELPRLPLWYLPIGAAALWLLGQLAVLVPALRASQVPPAVATRGM